MEDSSWKTPLYGVHIAAKARIVDFAGWLMPIQYGGILEEARAVRTAVGMFDVSHMGRIRLSGSGCIAFLQRITTNDVEAIAPGEAQYSLLTNDGGGAIDDIIVYREEREAYLLVVNAANARKDRDWLDANADSSTRLEDISEATAMIAVQGPEAASVLGRIGVNAGVLSLRRFQHTTGSIGGTPATFCRTGYTGEDGFEIVLAAARAEEAWDTLSGAGVAPCGLGARDVLRIEAGYPLYGHEIDEKTGPVEAGLMWAVSLKKGPFIGRSAIVSATETGPFRRLVGLQLRERIVPRQGYTVLADDETVGEVTSGVFSPVLGSGIAMAYLKLRYAHLGATVEVAIREKRVSARVVPKKSLTRLV